MPLFDGEIVGPAPTVACDESHTCRSWRKVPTSALAVIPADAGIQPGRYARKNGTPAFLPTPKRNRFGFAQAGAGVTRSRSRYFDAQGMIGTTLIAFDGEPSMIFELTAR